MRDFTRVATSRSGRRIPFNSNRNRGKPQVVSPWLVGTLLLLAQNAMNESKNCAELTVPALKDPVWGVVGGSRIRR